VGGGSGQGGDEENRNGQLEHGKKWRERTMRGCVCAKTRAKRKREEKKEVCLCRCLLLLHSDLLPPPPTTTKRYLNNVLINEFPTSSAS